MYKSLVGRIRSAGILGLVLAASGCSGLLTSETPIRLNGGGATFVDPIMTEWKQAYKVTKNVEIDYQSKGSGAGIQQMTARTIDFGCSDAPMKKAQLEAAIKESGEVIHIPLIMGPVVPAYNVPGASGPIAFNGQILGDIYLGKIKNWNDPAIKDLNKELTLPDLEIIPIYRSEASGTTNIFTEFLSKTNSEFKAKVGASTQPSWPSGVGAGERGNDGVAGRIKTAPGAIGYVESRYAKLSKLDFGPVVNKAGKKVLGASDSVTAAAANAIKQKQADEPYSLHELTYSLTNADGDDAYPIAGMSYCVLYKKQPAETGMALVEFIRWAVRDGQKYAKDLDYAPLPAELVDQIEGRLSQVEFQN